MKTGHSKHGFNYDSNRIDRVMAITTISLKDLLTTFKGCKILQLSGKAAISNLDKEEKIHSIGTYISIRNRTHFNIDFNHLKHVWDESFLLKKLKEYNIDDVAIDRIAVNFSDPDLIDACNDFMEEKTIKQGDSFNAFFYSRFFESKDDREIILETSDYAQKVSHNHWKIRKLVLTYLINNYQVITFPKSKHQPLINWTIGNKSSEDLFSDALIASQVKRRFSYSITQQYEKGTKNILLLKGIER